jgi:hypothetical protein
MDLKGRGYPSESSILAHKPSTQIQQTTTKKKQTKARVLFTRKQRGKQAAQQEGQ